MPPVSRYSLLGFAAVTSWAGPASAQNRFDQADPTIVEQALPRPTTTAQSAPILQTEARSASVAASTAITGTINAVVIDGAAPEDDASYAPAYLPFIGRELSRTELADLAGRIAEVARRNGFPFASASIGAQRVANGILHVSLDLGKVDAVRVIGASNAAADALLNRLLVTGGPVRRDQLERAILLTGDVPGVRVTSSRYTKQNGFGILLVTIAADRASAYVQLDNRGSAEVGPVRSTILANVRGIASAGDELAILSSQTPLQPSEFVFVRGRYSAPIDQAGSVLSVAASYGRSHPGASLKPLDVRGLSTDVAVALTHPVLRSRASSLWVGTEFRAADIKQTLAGRRIRNDRLATLSVTSNGFTPIGPGILRGEIGATVGLPLPGVSHQGDAMTSRFDGDARFVLAGYTADWTINIARPFSIVVASAGQLASRPLLATAEIGLGGPAFARGYDYAERTGDTGIMGSLELRADAGKIIPGIINRLQLYSFVDGGRVSNLRGGLGGGQLYSLGGGGRFGLGTADGMIEVALPLNANRFDTGTKRPRISVRLAKAF
ncbi:ShlB/FhaC/HecB family hemolysin secretion/activation protein [Sphingomonas abaci]|uniref:Hemolysin activation/secretion protein n=1 Tax=Sphingomonas abaci TaxID=237611 RepID=A0A7W7EY54_9SPHN|nr:ShlB/FhaC/HecB family hemolysin secretion/activation protein [Sphingomonas abaci]MBB4616040.1 hemolysin activation/secretion protein [Sphingomonas abaci]